MNNSILSLILKILELHYFISLHMCLTLDNNIISNWNVRNFVCKQKFNRYINLLIYLIIRYEQLNNFY